MFTPREINEIVDGLENDKDKIIWFLEATQERLHELLAETDKELEENQMSREVLKEVDKVIMDHAKKVLKSN